MIPVPGFYKHFSMCEALGIQVEPIPFSEEGVDSDWLMASVDRDPAIIGILCVPKYSNPTGHTYSPSVIRQLSYMAGPYSRGRDFHVFWDNTYAVHDLYPEACELASLRDAAIRAYSEDYIAVFGTTSKITLASLGIAAVGTSQRIGAEFCRSLNRYTISDDKLRQLQHVRFFEQTTIEDHMAKHAALVRPAFDGMLAGLEKHLSNEYDVRWTRPKGGFFISMEAPEGTAKRVNQLCASAGVKLTAAGACFPAGDLHDSHLRITPAMVPLPEIDRVAEIIALSIKLASAETPISVC
jgi:DNA-binding transcriptional MocR family regulator